MKKLSLHRFLFAASAVAVLGLLVPTHAIAGSKKNSWSYSNSNHLNARVSGNKVRITRNDGSTVSVVKTSGSKVDGVRFMNSNKQIAVASHNKGDSGVVELFDVRSGNRTDRIRVKDIRHGQPSWAAWVKN